MEIDKYLKMHLKFDLFFHYSEEENKILVTIDSPEWGDFFEERVLYNFIFSNKKR